MFEKERLEEIKSLINDPVHYPSESESDYIKYIRKDYFNWLIEQAERAQELENLKDAFDDLDSDYIDLHQENKRYHKAIKQAKEIAENNAIASAPCSDIEVILNKAMGAEE